MSVTNVKVIPCRACGANIESLTIESANPARHQHFQEQLLARRLLVMRCPACRAPHEHWERFVWTDLAGGLCVAVLRESERPGWPALEAEVRQTLSVPLVAEGPPVVRAWGATVALRLVFGLEELREKVLCRLHGVDDRLMEVLRIGAIEHDVAPLLEDIAPGVGLTFRFSEADRRVVRPWAALEEAGAKRAQHTLAFPGLFAPESAWVHWGRALRSPSV
jgi:hypothetical protein